MAEPRAIPEAVLREADKLVLRCLGKRFDINVMEIATALLAAELRGRTEQREADARICDDIGENGGNDGYFDWPAQCAIAIRNQEQT